MKTDTKSIIDLIVAASTNKELMDEFKKATSAENLQERWLDCKPGYSVSVEDCKKLFNGREKILKALKNYPVNECY